MRQITIKYQGNCKRCDKSLEVGQLAMYEKSMGCFCIGCEPKDVEDIRHFRQLVADKKAERLLGRANRIESQAEGKMSAFNHLRQDWAWVTQPGHIPGRQRALKNYDRGMELLKEAEQLKNRAENITNVRVKGDAQRRDEMHRQALDKELNIGSRIFYPIFRNNGVITKVFKKSYRVKFDDTQYQKGLECAVPKIFCQPLTED